MVAHAAPKCLLVCETKNRTHLKIGSCCPRLVLIFHSAAAAARRVALSWNCKMKMESRDGFGNSPLPNLLHIFRIGSKLIFRFLICVQIWFLSSSETSIPQYVIPYWFPLKKFPRGNSSSVLNPRPRNPTKQITGLTKRLIRIANHHLIRSMEASPWITMSSKIHTSVRKVGIHATFYIRKCFCVCVCVFVRLHITQSSALKLSTNTVHCALVSLFSKQC